MNTTRVLLLGANGRTGRHIRALLAQAPQISLTSVARQALNAYSNEKVEIGDVTDLKFITNTMKNQDMVIAALNGELLLEAQSIYKAALETKTTRIIWLTGIGIHGEAKGEYGKMLNSLVDINPDFVQAAKVIADPQLAYTLVRLPQLTDQQATSKYEVTRENEDPKLLPVSRENVARFMLFLAKHPQIYIRESISINDQYK